MTYQIHSVRWFQKAIVNILGMYCKILGVVYKFRHKVLSHAETQSNSHNTLTIVRILSDANYKG